MCTEGCVQGGEFMSLALRTCKTHSLIVERLRRGLGQMQNSKTPTKPGKKGLGVRGYILLALWRTRWASIGDLLGANESEKNMAPGSLRKTQRLIGNPEQNATKKSQGHVGEKGGTMDGPCMAISTGGGTRR